MCIILCTIYIILDGVVYNMSIYICTYTHPEHDNIFGIYDYVFFIVHYISYSLSADV